MRIWRLGLWAIAAVLVAGAVRAATFGDIRVASHLGEPFVAEVPLVLGEGERAEDVRVDVASPEDYQILEVYRDPAVDRIRVDVVQDARGARVKLTSAGALDTPFFNLVLRLTAGQITQFKKFPVFLDPPPAMLPARAATPARKQAKVPPPSPPKPELVAPAPKAVPGTASPEGRGSAPPAPFQPYGGWARSRGVYGPVVYGDTLITVARRLRTDERFTLNQIMVALFRKNPEAFGEHNINILKAGSVLKVPTAEEVAAIPPAEADRIVRVHNRRWEELKRTRPEYARLAEAQRTRYVKRVRVGRVAHGVPASPRPAGKNARKPEGFSVPRAAAKAGGGGNVAALREALAEAKARNEELSAQLAQRDARIRELERQLEAAKKGMSPTARPGGELEAELAATKEQLRKLRIQFARVRAELARARNAQAQPEAKGLSLIDKVLIGVIVVLLLVIAYLMAQLLRRRTPVVLPGEAGQEAGAGPGLAAAAAAAGAVAGGAAVAAAQPEEEEIPEIEVEEVPPAEREIGTETVPDLTEEDTGAMEPFVAEEEAPDANVDYLAEADVFLRYGLEDEAEKQVRMALKLDDQNPQAWAKLVEIARARGDEEAVARAEAEAREHLAGARLAEFDRLIAGEGAEEGLSEEKTMIVSADELLGGEESGAEQRGARTVAPQKSEEPEEVDALATVAMDLGLEDAMMPVEEPASEGEKASSPVAEEGETAKEEQEAEEGLDFDLGELGSLEASGEDEGAPSSGGEAAQEKPEEEEEGLDFDLGSLEEAGEEEVTQGEETAEADAVPEAEEDAQPEAAEEEKGLDFDLAGLDLDLGMGEEEEVHAEEDAEALVPSGGESPQAGEEELGLDFGDLGDLDLAGEQQSQPEPPEPSASVESPEEDGAAEEATVALEGPVVQQQETPAEDLALDLEGLDFGAMESGGQGEEEGGSGSGGEAPEESTQVLVQKEETPPVDSARPSGEPETLPLEEEEVPEIDLEAELGDLDIDMAIEETAREVDEFTSTISTAVLESEDEGASEEEAQEGGPEVVDLGKEEDLDDLDELLSELGLEDEGENKKG